MKKRIWALVMALTMLTCAAACTSETESDMGNTPRENSTKASGSQNGEKTKFSQEDDFLGGLRFGITEKEVMALNGEPNKKDTYGGTFAVGYEYKDFEADFVKGPLKDDRVLTRANSKTLSPTSKREIIRGISIGSTKDDVVAAFYYENRSEEYKKYTPADITDYYLYGNPESYLDAQEGKDFQVGSIGSYNDKDKDFIRISYQYVHSGSGGLVEFYFDSEEKVKYISFEGYTDSNIPAQQSTE